jgi:NADH:ubiquinone reductase (H+-translocating)
VSVRPPTRVVILGGSFAGLAVARHLEAALPKDGSVEVTLVSRDNYLLFTPMLAEVAAGELPPGHVAAPLRGFLRRVRVWQAEATALDLGRRQVTVQYAASEAERTLPHDQLILALGSVTSYHGVEGAAEYSLPFSSLADAAAIRARLIACFEQAAVEDDAATRRALLTFVVAGGGFSGVELAAALGDFLRETRRYYPTLAGEPLRLLLAHHGARLLEELDGASAAYTLSLLRRRGIAVRLGTGVTRVARDRVELSPGGEVPTHTVMWTAGLAPSPFVAALPLPKDRHGAVIVDEHLAVSGHPGIWALGDCASVPNPRGGSYGQTAQNAEREAPVVAHNVLAALRGAPLRAFTYRPMGMLASLGHHTAVGNVFGLRFAGPVAWLLWRSVYLAKLPGLDRKARVGLDWALDFLFPPNVLNTVGLLPAAFGAAAPGARAPATASADGPAAPAGSGGTPTPSAPAGAQTGVVQSEAVRQPPPASG